MLRRGLTFFFRLLFSFFFEVVKYLHLFAHTLILPRYYHNSDDPKYIPTGDIEIKALQIIEQLSGRTEGKG